MSYHLYIIESDTKKQLYIGQTNDLVDRLYRHNSDQNLATKDKGPWKLIYSQEFNSRSEAFFMFLFCHIKKGNKRIPFSIYLS